MTIQVARNIPWMPECMRLAMRGRVVLRLRPGEHGDHVPAHTDVNLGVATPASRLDAGKVDATIRAFSPTTRITRAYNAARNVRRPGKRHMGWDPIEETIGFSRTFRLEVDPDVSIVNLVSELAALERVEMVSPHYLCQAPFGVRADGARGGDYAREMIGAAEALAMEGGDSALIVAIVDSGVALDHPEFVGRLRPGLDTVDLGFIGLSICFL